MLSDELAARPDHTIRLWVAVDGDKLTIFQQCPERLLNINSWHTWDSAKRLKWPWEILGPEPKINGRPMTWDDDPLEIEVSWRVVK